MRRSSLLAAALVAVVLAGCYRGDPTNVIQKSPAMKEGEALYLRGRFVEARVRFRKVTNSSHPSDKRWALEARYCAARCDHLTGHYSEAVRVYNELLRSPKYARLEIRVRAARADISLETGNYKGAAHDYGRARGILERSPYAFNKSEVDRQKLLFGQGMALWSLRRLRESDQIFDRYMADFPEGRFIKEAKAHHTKFTGRPQETKFYVMVGGLSRIKDHAVALARKIRAKGFADVVIKKRTSASGFVYSVDVGAFDSRPEAYAQKRGLVAAGFAPAHVRP
jgi:tetratricopeptide (TPR) repeat protein